MNSDRTSRSYTWLAVGVFAGVVLAELLSKRMSPFLAWLVGGSLIGIMPAASERPRSAARIVTVAVATAVVAALAHGLTELVVP